MILPYIINVALILLACLAFYKLLLRRETFYKVNRYMLIICLGIAFALPLLQVPAGFSLRKVNRVNGVNGELSMVNEQQSIDNGQPAKNSQQPTVNTLPIVNNDKPSATSKETAIAHSPFTIDKLMGWLFWIYWFGVIVFAASFIFQLVLLLWRAYRNPVIIDGPYRIVEVSGDKAPCSFGNTIFINPSKYEWETYNQILMHEKVHIREKHTIDIVVAELLLIFQWFNPFAWIYRREIESNLEFLTDDQLMQREKLDKKRYQLSLVQVSAPHLPLSLTTNYNQSILKTRIAMMNKKRSNLHTAWKYFFLLPVFAFLACLLNEPVAKAQTSNGKSDPDNYRESNVKGETKNHGMETQGYWFAVIKDDKVNIRFSDEKMENENWDLKSGHSFNGSTFKLSELGTLPKGTSGTFNITREAGKMEMTGKFEGSTGMGTYKFVANKAYVDYMNKELKETLDDDDQMAFFFINIKKEFLTMLRSEGYKDVTKDDLIPVAALGIDKAYISSIRNNGFKDISLEDLVPLKALGVDEKYIKEIRSEYKDISTDQLVSFKAQGIDKAYIKSVRDMKSDKGEKGDKGSKDDPDDMVSYKAMNITPEFVNSFKAVGMTNVPHDELVAFKAVGVTPEYVKSWYDKGYKDINPEEFVGMKSQNVTPEYMKSFTDMGYKDIKPEDLVAFKALGITPEYVKSFETAGYKMTDLENVTALKAQGITPEYIKSFEAAGFKDISLDDIVAVKALGVTPEYIKDMRAKGFNYDKLQKYVTLKSID
ncbi:MAG: M56 family metallopeptidase [Bacteroidetes bacterium]|nr:MAG: M56 family metallopeptidase [Bacteroidota bacterium]